MNNTVQLNDVQLNDVQLNEINDIKDRLGFSDIDFKDAAKRWETNKKNSIKDPISSTTLFLMKLIPETFDNGNNFNDGEEENCIRKAVQVYTIAVIYAYENKINIKPYLKFQISICKGYLWSYAPAYREEALLKLFCQELINAKDILKKEIVKS